MQPATSSQCPVGSDHRYARSKDPKDRLILALDVGDASQALKLADDLRGHCRWMKVGMELFYAEGRDLIRRLQDRGFCIFLDLKLHDIPNTAAAAVRSVATLGVQMLTLHAAGGPVMMEAASSQARLLSSPPLLAGVTVLTSMDEGQLQSIAVESTPEQQVLRLAALALKSGLEGLVASPLEVRALRQAFGPEPVLIVPGIRSTGSQIDDQRRSATPETAIRDGASLLVVGRPITRAASPVHAAEEILGQIEAGLAMQQSLPVQRGIA